MAHINIDTEADSTSLSNLPSLILANIFAHSDPSRWWALGNTKFCSIIDTTSFRCSWVCHLANNCNIAAKHITRIEDITEICDSTLRPISDLVGSDSWLSEVFVHALNAHRPRLLRALAPGLLWTAVLSGKQKVAYLVAQCSDVKLDILEGKLLRDLLVRQPALWVLELFATNCPDFSKFSGRDNCFDMTLMVDWVLTSRVDLLGFLADHNLEIPVRSLIEYALSASTPATVELLMRCSAGQRNELSWNDLLLMASAEASTRADVYELVVNKTEPSIVWAFAASCLAAHALLDNYAYQKFSVLRGLPNAELWIVRSIGGQTPIQRVCEKLTFENLTSLTPFIRDYLDLGVSAVDMPRIVAALCH
ncbi:hypothetical protein LPJ66_002446 [Kickxella alabastrina]|uniref:Uncharacterized protein n=1 Tax=Kickxella alabastrina TaxID=61397 RepID=A0ACC1IQD7_9FUNG|nr:hypothetical protein LPJ66_002446 [Kickxella alabastrina]